MFRMHYRPNEFADLAGVSVKTLHRWDSSGKLKPLRTIGGHRYYTDEHINQIKGIVKKLSYQCNLLSGFRFMLKNPNYGSQAEAMK